MIRTNIDARIFLTQFLSKKQQLLLAKNERNYVGHKVKLPDDIFDIIETLREHIDEQKSRGVRDESLLNKHIHHYVSRCLLVNNDYVLDTNFEATELPTQGVEESRPSSAKGPK